MGLNSHPNAKLVIVSKTCWVRGLQIHILTNTWAVHIGVLPIVLVFAALAYSFEYMTWEDKAPHWIPKKLLDVSSVSFSLWDQALIHARRVSHSSVYNYQVDFVDMTCKEIDEASRYRDWVRTHHLSRVRSIFENKRTYISLSKQGHVIFIWIGIYASHPETKIKRLVYS